MRTLFYQNSPTFNHNLIAPPFASDTEVVILAPDVQQAITIPTGAKYVTFASTAGFYAKEDDATITVPIASGTDNGLELNPDARSLPDSAIALNLIASAACIVVVGFYAQF